MKNKWKEEGMQAKHWETFSIRVSKSNIQNAGMYLINSDTVKSTIRTVTAFIENTLYTIFKKFWLYFYDVIDI